MKHSHILQFRCCIHYHNLSFFFLFSFSSFITHFELQRTSTVHTAPSLPSRSLHPSSSELPPCTVLLHCHHGPFILTTAHFHQALCSSSCHHGPFIPAPAHFHRAPISFTTITVPSLQLQRTSTMHRAPPATITVPSAQLRRSYSWCS